MHEVKAILLGWPFRYSGDGMKPFKKNLYRLLSYFNEISVVRTGSDINNILEVNMAGGRLVLDSKNANYSYGGLHSAFQQIFKKLDLGSYHFKKILILGFGAGSVASILRNEYGIDSEITGVEQDEVVLNLAVKYFNIEQISDIELVNEDAFTFMESNNKQFDLIIVDIYIDQKVPEKFESIQFLEYLKQALSEKSMIIFNKLCYNEEVVDDVFRLEERFNKIIGDTEMYSVPGVVPNYMLVYNQKV